MCTLKLFVILLLVLLVLGVLAFVLDSVKEKEIDNPNYPTRAYKIARGCSFIVKFGMILTACALVGSLAPAGLGLAMAFAIPKPTSVPKGSWFDHSHNVATTLPFGAIIPLDWRFLNAGEKVNQNISGFCRALQLKAPAMQDIDLKWATFFVPFRILCDSTEQIVSKPKPASLNTSSSVVDSIVLNPTDVQFPYMPFDADAQKHLLSWASAVDSTDYTSFGAFTIGGLMDYLGFPCESFSYLKSNATSIKPISGSVPINLLPLMAYHSICNHFFVDDCFRREDSSNVVSIDTSWVGEHSLSQVAASGLLSLRFSQYESDPFLKASSGSRIARINTASQFKVDEGGSSTSYLDANKVRGMFALDEFARKVEYFYGDMRKQIKYMFGVITSDRSAMSPILVNAGSQPVQVSELNNTTLQSVDATQTRQSAGKMLSSFGQHNKTFVAEELGVYITLAWIRPRTCYLNRLPIQFETYLDSASIPNPLFSEIGDVALKRRQVDFNPFSTEASYGVSTNNIGLDFGYNTRYVLEKYSFDSFTGDFRDSLVYWHCAREFTTSSRLTPTYQFRQINPSYLKSDQSLNRIFSVIDSVDGARPFQLQMRFNTAVWQFYPHIDDEL